MAVTILGLTLRLDQVDLHAPLNYLWDANIFLLRAKAIVEGNWIWSNPRLGMPFGADWRDFPMNITLDSGWMWVLSHFTRSPPLIVNLQWLIAVGLAAALACYAFTRLAFKLAPSAAFGAIFALLPYTFFRGTRHLHCEDYAIPLIALSAIEIVRGTWTASVPRTGSFGTLRSIAKVPLYAWIGCLIAGLAYAYTAFFAVFVLMMAGVLSLLKNRDIRQIVLPAALAGVVVGVTVVDLSPSLIFWARNGQNAKMLFKSPAEAELYALKIRYLITPIPDHPIPLLRAAEARLSTAKYPLFPDENEWGRLGTIGSIGFLCLLAFAFRMVVGGRWLKSLMDAAIFGPCASLTLACVLFGSVGGFGDFFNTFISPDIRCYTRIFPFIGFFSLAAAAALLISIEGRILPVLRLPLWLALAVAAGYDQAVPSYAIDHNQPLYWHDANFVRYIETLLPEKSAVFELPFADFPNEIPAARQLVNDLLRPYLHSTKYSWSWPAVSGTTPAEWNRLVSSQAPAEMLRAVVKRGFSGLWLDSAGYVEGASPEAAITAELHEEPRRSPDGRFLFYDLRDYNVAINKIEARMTLAELTAQSPVQVVFERGFYYEEHAAGRTWHWSLGHGRITLVNPLNLARRISLSMHIQTANPISQSVMLSWNSGDVLLPGSSDRNITINLEPFQTVPVDLRCDCRPTRPEGAPRNLYFYASDISVRDVP